MGQFSIILVAAALLGGCGLAQQAKLNQEHADAQKTRDREAAECERLYPPHHRPVSPRLKCVTDAYLKFGLRGDPNMDLLRVMSAQMLVAGERFDGKKTSQVEFEAEKATVLADYNSKILQRRNSTMVANAAADQAAAAQHQAWSAHQQALAASIPKTTTCNRFGNTVTCY